MDGTVTQTGGKRRYASRWSNIALIALITFALIGGFWVTFRTIESERAERLQVQRTNQILIELQNINRAVLNAETGQRGYMITLDRTYLAPYRAGSEQMEPAINRLREKLEPVATERQTELLDEIEQQADIKMREMARTVHLLENNDLMAARAIVLTDRGQISMQRLRLAVREMERIEQAVLREQVDETAQAESRTLPMLAALLILVLAFILFAIRLNARAAEAEAEAAQAFQLAEARDRADLLARELNHRVKNLFAVILAIVDMSAKNNPEAKPLVQSISNRIRALLTAHEVTQGALDRPVAVLGALVDTTLAPYRSEDRVAELDGPEVVLPAKFVTPLGLVLHELTTNAVKYGAWSDGGNLRVSWTVNDGMLDLDWCESGCKQQIEPRKEGFGSLLMKGAARQLEGTIDRTFESDGCRVKIRFPLETLVAAG